MLKWFGWALFGVGGLLILIGLLSDVTVTAPRGYDPYLGPIGGGATVNFHKMFVALSMIIVGGFAMVAGSIFLAAGLKAPAAAAEASHANTGAVQADARMNRIVAVFAIAGAVVVLGFLLNALVNAGGETADERAAYPDEPYAMEAPAISAVEEAEAAAADAAAAADDAIRAARQN